MNIIVFLAVVCITAFFLWILYLLYKKIEGNKKKARYVWLVAVISIVLSLLVTYVVQDFPEIYEQIKEWWKSWTQEVETANLNQENLPEISINIGEGQMEPGEIRSVAYSFASPEAYEHELLWKSSNEDCISVDQNGKLTAKAIGQSMISVSFEEYPDDELYSFRMYVINDYPNEDTKMEIAYSQICRTATDEDEYYVYFNITNYENLSISAITISLYSDEGVMPSKQEYSQPKINLSNCAAAFYLDYYGTYTAVCTIATSDGAEYQSIAHILRPYKEIE